MFMFWSLVRLLTQKPLMAVLREGEWLQSPFPMGLKTDPDGITEAGTILSPHIGSLESRQDSYKRTKRPENHGKSPALHDIAFLSSCRQPCLVWSSPATQLLPGWGFLTGLSSYYTHLAAAILTSIFCPETGCFTVLSGVFLLQHVWILLWITIVLCSQNSTSVCFFQFSSISVWELLTASWLLLTLRMLLGLNPKPLFRFRFCYTTFYLQRMYTFPYTYSNQKKTGSFIPKPLLIPSLWALLHYWASSWQQTIFGYTAVVSFSEGPVLQMVVGWKGARRSATLPCTSPLLFQGPQHLLGTQYRSGMLWPSWVPAPSQGCTGNCFSLSQTLFTHTHTELSCTHCPAPGRWLSVDSEISASQVLLRTLHELIVLNGAFCCA